MVKEESRTEHKLPARENVVKVHTVLGCISTGIQSNREVMYTASARTVKFNAGIHN